MPREGQTGTAPDGTRVVFQNGQVVPLSQSVQNPAAPGVAYLPKGRTASDKSEDAYYRKWRTDNDPAVQAAENGIGQARRAEGLLAQQEKQGQGTGGWYGVPVVGNALSFMDPQLRELDAIQSEVARSKRTPGEGAISDFDAKQFLAMTYGKDKPLKTNQALIQAQRLANDAVIQKRQFGEWYRQSYGSMDGFGEAWSRYSQDNPILDAASEATGIPTLNNNRQTWRDYFGAGGDARPTQAATDATRGKVYDLSSGQSRESIPRGALYKDKLGNLRRNDNGDAGNPILQRAEKAESAPTKVGGGKAGGDSAPVRVQTPEEAERLAPGTVFITPDGRRKVR